MANFFEEEYNKFIWQQWWYKAGELKSLKQTIPPKHGVYIIRAPHLICRVRESSNVIYIGQSGGGRRRGRQGIGRGNGTPGRLFNTRGPDKWVRERIEDLYQNNNFTIECSFVDSDTDPIDIEKGLLRAFLKTYFELPPANHQSVQFTE